jgi:hypothetical protein
MRGFWIGLGAASAVMLAAPAFAGDTLCLWNHIPQAKRDALLAQGATSPKEAMQTGLSDAEMASALLACKVNAQAAQSAKLSLAGYTLDMVLGRWFETHEKVDHTKLDAAWSALTPAQRDGLIKTAGDNQTPPDKATFLSFAKIAGLSSADKPDLMTSETGEYLFIYLMGRALRAANESKF